MNLKAWKLWAALIAASLDVAVNLATEWKHNMLAWAALPVLAGLGAWTGTMADKGIQRRTTRNKWQPLPVVLHYDERNGSARRTVSTTSEKVATEFLKRVPLPLETPLESTKSQGNHS
ncbi:hypothetical protein [Microbispora triticiradicis]|uniref:hypothetical protein n=1 Tax=Microbispora triticiradicis TaxID=2200763 RepID=UPI001AD76060|nr:hypothetical protein [Microbispora triticiradicis]MBO4269944.1 hypothetical protein [Microbispora triticiradicis]